MYKRDNLDIATRQKRPGLGVVSDVSPSPFLLVSFLKILGVYNCLVQNHETLRDCVNMCFQTFSSRSSSGEGRKFGLLHPTAVCLRCQCLDLKSDTKQKNGMSSEENLVNVYFRINLIFNISNTIHIYTRGYRYLGHTHGEASAMFGAALH